MTRALIAAAALSLTLSGACRAGDAPMTETPAPTPSATPAPGSDMQADAGERGFGLWRVEGAPGRCLISLSKTPAGPGAYGVLAEGCQGEALATAKRWRLAAGVIEVLDEQGRVLARLEHQGPDVLTGETLRLTRAPEA